MRSGTRLGVLVGLPVLLVAVGAVLAALLWLQRQGDSPIEQAINDARRPGAARLAEGSTGASTAPAAQAASQAATGGRQAVAVRRGPIVEQVTLTGRVAASDEVLLGFGIAGRVETVAVKPGDTVQEGQLLMEADAAAVQRELAAARSRVEVGVLRSEQAQQQAQARKKDQDRRAAADASRKEQAIREAESALRRAQNDYERVKAGAPAAERRSAEAAVQSAQLSYDAALAEYNKAFSGPGDIEMRLAEQSINAARIQQAKAEAELQKLANGADPNDLRAAEREMMDAQNSYARAVAAVEKVSQPDPVAVSAAEREVQRAELNLRAAQAQKTSDKSSRFQKEIDIRNAQADLQGARDRLNQARRGAPPADVENARRDMLSARSAVEAAKERLEKVRQGPDPLVIEQAKVSLESARLAVEQAEQKAATMSSGPPEDMVARLAVSVQQAQTSLQSARATLAEVNAKPSKDDLRDAEDKLAAAQSNLERTQADAEAPAEETTDTTDFDLQVLERGLAQDRAQVETLERQLAQSRLRAPFAGTVSSVKVRSGDPFEAERAVLTLARPGDPVLRADVTERDASRLAAGQRAVVRLEGAEGGEFDASVDSILEGETGVGRTAQLAAVWPEPAPAIGTPVQVVVTLREKNDVLLIPQKAIRSAGARRFVEVVDGPNRTMTDVEIGIVSNGQAEVVSGLRQDQLVLVNP
ncbi:MAG: efflux RND transporter periplasmic adaptor subunit [Chloroflexota bacterium]